jgi:hypothetical protein
MLTPQGEAKELDTIGKRAKHKLGNKELPKQKCKLPLIKCVHFSPRFLTLDVQIEFDTFLPLVGNA